MQELLNWLTGNLSNEARVWTALAPAIIAVAYFVGGFLAFLVRCAIFGVPRDQETLNRGSTVLVGFFLRHYFFWVIRPLWWAVLRSGLPANAITSASALLGMASGVAVAAGRFALGGWLFLFSGILDVMDGRVARARKESTPAGAAIDSILDRYTDSAMLMGLAWYYRDRWVLVPILFSLLGTSVVPYVRARGEGLGVSVKGGTMQRLERVLYLGGAVTLSPIYEAIVYPNDTRPMHWLAVVGLCFLAVTSNITGASRFFTLVRILSGTQQKEAKATRSLSTLFGLHTLASIVATVADYALFRMLVDRGQIGIATATILGCTFGAVINFNMNRHITFPGQGKKLMQAGRYALVSSMSALLNAGGVALMASHPSVSTWLSWWIVRGVVQVAWNFPLHRDYVFAAPSEEATSELEPGHAN
jgi:phosphatidylglycerophosphate synthase/putative flippase GtrA